jgi:hypothetical protein
MKLDTPSSVIAGRARPGKSCVSVSRVRGWSPTLDTVAKNRIERAYTLGETLGVAVWCKDEAGSYGTEPYTGSSWQLENQPAHLPHQYFREGTAKMMTLLHPKTGEVRVKGVTNTRRMAKSRVVCHSRHFVRSVPCHRSRF